MNGNPGKFIILLFLLLIKTIFAGCMLWDMDEIREQSKKNCRHDWKIWEITTHPTCITNGEKTWTCSFFAEHKRTEIIPELGHNYSNWTMKDPVITGITNIEIIGTCLNGPDCTINNIVSLQEYIITAAKQAIPVDLIFETDLGTTASGSVFSLIFSAIRLANQLVNLNFSASTMADTTFTPPNFQEIKNNIVTITLPDTTTNIITGSFNNYTVLESFTGMGLTNIGPSAFSGSANLKEIFLSSELTTIGQNAFRNCTSLEQITSLEGLTSIGNTAFENNISLKQITLPAELINIGQNAFRGCANLIFEVAGTGPLSTINEGSGLVLNGTDLIAYPSVNGYVVLPPGLTNISDFAFDGCTRLTQITLPEGLISIGTSAFANSSLIKITMPEGLTNIGASAFTNCTNLSDITFQRGLLTIGAFAFSNCTSLTQIILPEGLQTIGDYAFQDCINLTDVTLQEGLTDIGAFAFAYNTRLTNIILPEGLQNIGQYTFTNCTNLEEISLPIDLERIGLAAFYNCRNLSSIISLNPSPPALLAFTFDSTSPFLRISVPEGRVAAYKAANGWRDIADNIHSILCDDNCEGTCQ
jgi:ubiquitin C-terminal hydrolase